jgi:hypothetical protein
MHLLDAESDVVIAGKTQGPHCKNYKSKMLTDLSMESQLENVKRCRRKLLICIVNGSVA